jgi:hypothetical protein
MNVEPIQSLQAIEVVLALAGFIWWFYGPWQRLLEDAVRQQLFEIRDGLFDLAVSEKALSDPGYRAARERLNAAIRFAHHTTWMALVAGVLVGLRPVHPVLQSSNPRIDAEIRRIRREIGMLALGLIQLRSLPLLLLSLLAAPIFLLTLFWSLLSSTIDRLKSWIWRRLAFFYEVLEVNYSGETG